MSYIVEIYKLYNPFIA